MISPTARITERPLKPSPEMNTAFLADSIMGWFRTAVPQPKRRHTSTQFGVHLKEVAEMLEELEPANSQVHVRLMTAISAVSGLAEYVKANGGLNVKEGRDTELLDSICDQTVTALGIGHMKGYDVLQALSEVNASNWSKFVHGKPLFNEDLKIIKGPEYFRPDLERFTNVESVPSGE